MKDLVCFSFFFIINILLYEYKIHFQYFYPFLMLPDI